MALNESVTFANYNILQHRVETIYAIGKDDTHPRGVIPEIAAAFGHELSERPDINNLGGLISKVGPAKELQSNIVVVRQALGTDRNGIDIARNWVERSGILAPVERSYMTYVEGKQISLADASLMIATSGVRNWMQRRAASMKALRANNENLADALLVAGNRPMKTTEGPDVQEGMTEADYMRDIVAADLANSGITVSVVEVPSSVGDEVMREGGRRVKEHLVGRALLQVVLVSNAGAWPQNGGQLRRALREYDAFGPSFDQNGDQLVIVADEFPLGETGDEPTATHQNPFSALGQIVRNAQEFTRQY